MHPDFGAKWNRNITRLIECQVWHHVHSSKDLHDFVTDLDAYSLDEETRPLSIFHDFFHPSDFYSVCEIYSVKSVLRTL